MKLQEINRRFYKPWYRIYFKKYDSYLIFREIKKIYKKWQSEISEYNKDAIKITNERNLKDFIKHMNPDSDTLKRVREIKPSETERNPDLIRVSKSIGEYCMKLSGVARRKFIRLFLDLYKSELG